MSKINVFREMIDYMSHLGEVNYVDFLMGDKDNEGDHMTITSETDIVTIRLRLDINEKEVYEDAEELE